MRQSATGSEMTHLPHDLHTLSLLHTWHLALIQCQTLDRAPVPAQVRWDAEDRYAGLSLMLTRDLVSSATNLGSHS